MQSRICGNRRLLAGALAALVVSAGAWGQAMAQANVDRANRGLVYIATGSGE